MFFQGSLLRVTFFHYLNCQIISIMQTDIHISYEMIYQRGESWVNYYEPHWVKNTIGMWVCINDGRAVDFYSLNRIGEVVESEELPTASHPDLSIDRDKELGASYQHIYNCGSKGYKKIELSETKEAMNLDKIYYKEAGIYTDSFGNFSEIKHPSLSKMRVDINSSTPVDDIDVKFIWEAIYIGEVVMCLSQEYDGTLSFRAKGSSPHNRVKFALKRRSKGKFYFQRVKKVIVDEDKWYG
jgi:hypothetical protein